MTVIKTAPIEPKSSPFLPTAAPLFPPVPELGLGLGLRLELGFGLGPELKLGVPLGVVVCEPVPTRVDDEIEVRRVLLLPVLEGSELLVLEIGIDLEEVIRDDEGQAV